MPKILLALFVAFLLAGSVWAFLNVFCGKTDGPPDPGTTAALGELRKEVAALRRSEGDHGRRLAALEAMHAPGSPSGAGPHGEEAKEQPPEEVSSAAASEAAAAGADGAPPEEGEGEGSEESFEESLARLIDPATPDREKTRIWRRYAQQGLTDRALAAFEKRAAENPRDPGAQVDFGHACIQKLFTVGDGEKGTWSLKAHAAYDQALAIDDHHWEARFSRAINYAFTPAIFGVQTKAITEFETLISQQESQPPQPRFAEPYIFLGNLYQNQGQAAKAQEVWKKGSSLFPDNAELRERTAAEPPK